ncbi:hypothetical protein DYB38_010688 [Aphanomyces astaci]|uniref:Uncharacterized protein n=3 Tax=Aphanomyces astaci TaxID=112090 RepID=A0A397CN02_APHAT|nr:hypothetical protein DYB34_012469 [Aphanomyces astaci]RHY46734.1 hypothetical protein DYB38_010688 [Aphanomyces astaci]
MKSTCQQRLEARQAQLKASEISPSEQLQAMGERISRARENRKQHVAFRRHSARDRVMKAQAVARATFEDVQSRSQGQQIRLQTRLEDAEKRRLDKLAQTTSQCQQRNERVLSALQGLADRTMEKRRIYDASVRAARYRRAVLTSAYVSKLEKHANDVESKKDRILQSRRLDAATSLQRWFRHGRHVREVHAALRPLRPSTQAILDLWASVGRSTVDTSMMLLQNRQTAAKAHAVGKVLFPATSFRILLMAGMLMHHPKDVMDQGFDPVLHFTAKRVCHALMDLTTMWSTSLAAFASSWRRWESSRLMYTSTFAAWKKRDGERLTTDMLNVYAELFTVLTQATADGTDSAMSKTKDQLKQLRSALVQALGSTAATDRLDALEQELAAKLSGKPAAAHAPSTHPTPRSPAKKPNLEFTKSVFANDSLTHELILNPRFQLPVDDFRENGSLERRVQATMHQAFWDQVQVTQDPQWIAGILVELRDALGRVCKVPRNFLNDAQLEALADAEWTEWVALQQQVLHVIAVNEAPARSESTAARRALVLDSSPTCKADGYKELTSFFRFCFDKADEIRGDSLNAHLALLAPYLQRHGVEHEAKKFEQRVAAGSVTLSQTTAWLQRQHGTDVRTIVRSGLIALVETYIESPDKLWPETFAMDVGRVRGWRNRVDATALQASCVALVREECGHFGATYPAEAAAALCAKLAILLDESCGSVKMDDLVVQVVHEVGSYMKTPWPSPAARETFQKRVADVARPSNVIFRLFFQRIVAVLKTHVMEWDGKKKAGNDVAVPSTLALFAPDLNALCREMAHLAKHNEAVHATTYNRLVREAATIRP